MLTRYRRAIFLLLALTTMSGAYAAAESTPGPDYKCQKIGQSGQALRLADSVKTFEDTFDSAATVTNGSGTGPWFAAIHGDFGGTKFLPPGVDGPFSFDRGAMTIRLQNKASQWTSGIIQSVNSQGRGFSQRYGYFEMRAKFPKGAGTWPAFWLKTVNQYTVPSQTRAEVDVVEAYGDNDWSGHHSAVHLWPGTNPPANQVQQHWFSGCYNKVNADMFDGNWHTYGIEVMRGALMLYFDRHQIAKFPSLPQTRKPLYLIVDLALMPEQAGQAQSPKDMVVDYVRVWQRKKNLPAAPAAESPDAPGAADDAGE